MRVYVATKNAGKMRELREIFAGSPIAVDTYDDYADVVEGESSYAENAALKARALRAQLEAAGISAAVLGDDSGLEVRALGDRPGVLSARYGGPNATWSERRRGLIGELAATGSFDRSARFVCALHFIDEAGRETATLETIAGAIAPEERGEAGFSYDPIFLLPERGVTFAELPAEEKNRISHRARSAAALLAALEPSSAEPEPAPSGGN
jgi:XTP/dITP diphosphohydrolase